MSKVIALSKYVKVYNGLFYRCVRYVPKGWQDNYPEDNYLGDNYLGDNYPEDNYPVGQLPCMTTTPLPITYQDNYSH